MLSAGGVCADDCTCAAGAHTQQVRSVPVSDVLVGLFWDEFLAGVLSGEVAREAVKGRAAVTCTCVCSTAHAILLMQAASTGSLIAVTVAGGPCWLAC